MGLFIFAILIGLVVVIVYLVKENHKKNFKENYRLGQANPSAEKYCVVVDVETTGLIEDKSLRPTKNNLDNFPRIVEIAWAVFSRKGELISEACYLIKQSSPIPKDAIKIHGIKDSDCEKEGCEIGVVLQNLSQEVAGCLRIVGHNIMFDKRVIESEFVRAGFPHPFKGMTKYDTLQMARQHFKMGGYPTLGEVYKKLMGEEALKKFTSHRASDDVAMTSNIFFNLKWFGNVYQGKRRATTSA